MRQDKVIEGRGWADWAGHSEDLAFVLRGVSPWRVLSRGAMEVVRQGQILDRFRGGADLSQ